MDLYHHHKYCKIYTKLKFINAILLFNIMLRLKSVWCQNNELIINNNTSNVIMNDNNMNNSPQDYFIGPCLVSANNMCSDGDITFYLYTRQNANDGHQFYFNDTSSNVNLKNYGFNPKLQTKIIVHGYNSHMLLDSMVNIKNEYIKKYNCNIIAIDWSRYAVAPCYPFAVYNARHVGKCLAQLINRLRDMLTDDIHVIGFSLGAHVPAFAANELRPYKISRITGLDPAMPLFVSVNNDEKLDENDAKFVDVFHTNAFIQGKVERCGHVDFYMNGGINQPGCSEYKNPFGCDHHRAPEYFAESINSKIGFWGWSCSGFIHYLVGYCPPKLPAVRAGDDVDKSSRGFYIVTTNSTSPFAQGIFTIDIN